MLVGLHHHMAVITDLTRPNKQMRQKMMYKPPKLKGVVGPLPPINATQKLHRHHSLGASVTSMAAASAAMMQKKGSLSSLTQLNLERFWHVLLFNLLNNKLPYRRVNNNNSFRDGWTELKLPIWCHSTAGRAPIFDTLEGKREKKKEAMCTRRCLEWSNLFFYTNHVGEEARTVPNERPENISCLAI